MRRIRNVSLALGGWLGLAATFATAPAFAQAACQQWDLSGYWSFVQSNGTTPGVTLQQTGNQLHGNASYFYTTEHSAWVIGTVVDDHAADGPAVGTINGNSFELTIYWNNNSIGVYTGEVGPQGLIVGNTYDKNDPGTTAQWHSNRVATCSAAAAAAPPTPAKPVLALGRVQLPAGTPAPPAKTMCEAAASARARNSPAAPGLERQCNEFLAAHPAEAAAAAPTVAFARVPHVGPPAPVMTICQYAESARARNSPAAPGLEKQCNEYLAAHPAAAAPTPAPANMPAAPSPPVQKPHDLVIGRITYRQDDQPVTQPVVGATVAITCNYFVNEVASPFVFKIQPWQGSIQIGGQAPRTLTFQGDPQGGQHEVRRLWKPSAAGRTPISCVLNQGFEDAEANGGNNRWNETIEVLAGDDAAPQAQ